MELIEGKGRACVEFTTVNYLSTKDGIAREGVGCLRRGGVLWGNIILTRQRCATFVLLQNITLTT